MRPPWTAGLAGYIHRTWESQLFRQVGLTYSAQMIGAGLGLFVQLFLQRALGVADYGILSLAVSVGTLVQVFTDAGVSHAMVRFGSKYLAEDPSKAGARFVAALLLRLALTVIVSAAGLIASTWIAADLFQKPELFQPLILVFVGMGAATLYGYWLFLIQTLQRFGVRSTVVVTAAVLRAGAVLVVSVAAVLTPSTAVIIDIGANVTGFLIGMLFVPRGLLRWDAPEIRVSIRELVPYCRFTGVLIVGDTIFNELDTNMLGILADERTVGLYRAAWTYAMVLGFLNMSVSNVMFPKVTSISNAVALRAFIRHVLRFTIPLAIATLPILPLVAWWVPWFDPDYTAAVPIFFIMYVGLGFELVVGPLGYVLYSVERPAALVGVQVVKILLNVAGNLLLIPPLGAQGAALATVVTRIAGGLIGLWVIRQALNGGSARAPGR